MENFSSYQNSSQGREQDFQKLSEKIGSSIQKISQNVSSMQRMINQIGTHQDSRDLRTQLHTIHQYTQQLVKDTIGYIKELNAIPPVSIQSEQRQRKMQKERLQDEFTSTLNAFQAAQRKAAQKEKEEVNKVKAQAMGDPISSFKKDPQLIELQGGNVNKFQQQVQMQDESELESLQEQERAIRQLETDINDVNQIFKELGAMVHEQGGIVDSIEASVESTQDYVSQGTQQLREASNYKNKIRKRKLILAIILGVILTIIVIIIIWQAKS
ncbi:syntaxin-7 [Agrilus planipennis]|uniref:Syntaxin-7 n=1 Tax=Agrilus planipennis TaxID=224129 RepID=A0A1W4XJB4_AGRPL|nr:syntaxin-7 [Agrilus planipennis]XP_018336074.1 syntaxin-7 [Agrilus planipennis]